LSLGLIGKVGVHQVDAFGWFMNERPVSVTGFGSIIQWNEDRNVPDTIQTVFDYPSGARMMYDCTLANSFDASYDMIYGSYATLMMRGARAWMFKEAGDPIVFETKGKLDVNGKSAPVSMQVSIAKGEGDKLKVSGKTKLKMSQFGIVPPAPKVALGLITTGNEVSVEFNWFVAQKK
jgi:predicted dehydrogenase